MSQPKTRHTLIAQLHGQRNEQAWLEFVSAYEPFLRRLIERQGVPASDVPDVTQQVLIGIARSIKQWQDDGRPASFRRWLSRVARNVAIKYMARSRRQIGGCGGTQWLAALEQQADPTDDACCQEYEYELVVWAAETVQGEFRATSWQAFRATLVDGRSVSDVAAELGVTPGSIYMSRSRIMARIRAKVNEVLEE